MNVFSYGNHVLVKNLPLLCLHVACLLFVEHGFNIWDRNNHFTII